MDVIQAPKFSVDGATKLIKALEALPEANFRLEHNFTPGLYRRTLFVPAGTRLVTKIHRTEHPFTVMQGDILVFSPEGGVQRITAPYTGVTKPGTIRIAVALTDTVWQTFHPTPETDLAKLEQELVFEPTPEKLKEIECRSLQLA